MEPQEQDPRPDRTSRRIDALFRAGGLGAIVILTFLAGSVMTVSGTFPGPQIAAAYEGGKALYAQLTHYQNIYQTDLWYPQRGAERGVTIHRPDKAQDGFTLYTSGHAPAAYLIDME